VLYVSDFDPAGDDMPSAVARQLEYWLPRYAPKADLKLTPVALTKAQVQQYQLPRIPIKDSDLRKARFEDVHGEGAVELDALEALYPGELQRILAGILDQYYDGGLATRFEEAEAEANEQIEEAWVDATTTLQDEAQAIETEARQVYARYERFLRHADRLLQRDLEPLKERLAQLRQDVEAAQDAFDPPMPERPAPDVSPGDEGDWLYASDRAYLDQLAYYKARRTSQDEGETA
jgi:hypothetical protein